MTAAVGAARAVPVRAPKPQTAFAVRCGRLALYRARADHVDYWREYWNDAKRGQLVQTGEEGDLGEFAPFVRRYVPRDLPVLEAGCGPARLVLALQKHGYRASGIDYEETVVRFVRERYPELDVRCGDVLSLDLPSGSLGCYLSVGVVEHFEDGPGAALQEARRVLHPRGIALISVPYLNPLRAALRRADPRPSLTGLHFHQYYFSVEQFRHELERAGLAVVDERPYSVEAFVIREHQRFHRVWRSGFMRERVKRPMRALFTNAPMWLRRRYGHMIMFACRPV